MELFLSGLASGFDWKSLVEQLADVQRAPQRRLRTEQSTLNRVGDALSSLATELGNLLAKAKTLKAAPLYHSWAAASTDTSVATASTDANPVSGSYVFDILQLATAAGQRGRDDVGQGVDANADIMSSAAGFTGPIITGRFTVNGEQIEIQAGDTLNGVLARISSQTGLTAIYDSENAKITLSDAESDPIVLGSAADNSNFLQAARLTNNGTGTITSGSRLGGINISATLSSARFQNAVTSGTFAINGVAITVDADNHTVADVLNAVNQSAAGVIASYDSLNDRFVLANKVTGDIGFSLEEGTSNFLSAAHLTPATGGTLVNGRNAEFTVNGGSLATSQTNSLTAESHGIGVLTVNALKAGQTTVSIANDTAPLKQGIIDFIDQYNKVQRLIAIQTASSTDAKGTVTSGVLAGDPQVAESARVLRNLISSDALGLSATVKRLESIGFKSDGYSNEISLASSGALDSAIANSLDEIQTLFSDPASGIATRMNSYLEGLVGFEGSLWRHRDAVAGHSTRIDEQVGQMERAVLASRQDLFARFRSMEKTLAQINRQASFFTQRFG